MQSWIAGLKGLGAPRARADVAPPGDAQAQADASEDTVRATLARILHSPGFDATPRSRRFLTYIVEETLCGRSDRIKAFAIATDVFGRGADFDAHSDPIVRLEAGRLRRALEHYYQQAGLEDALVIGIPKGSYVPSFEVRRMRHVGAAAAPAGRRWIVAGAVAAVGVAGLAGWFAVAPLWPADAVAPAVPRLLVRPFEDLTGAGGSASVAKGLTQEIIGQVVKFKDIVTIEGADAGQSAGNRARYVLAGNVSLDDGRLRLQARVLKTEDSTVLWAQSYEAAFEPSQVIAIESDIARRIATALGQPYGVIFKADAERTMPNAPEDWAAYSCTLSYYAYRANLDARTHPTVRKCLEDAVTRFPTYATAWALLSQTYVDEIRFRYPIDPSMPPASLDRALAAARRAVDLDSANVRGLQAEMLALYFGGQIDSSLAVGERALAVNPNDVELIGEFGSRLAVSGRWDRGCSLIGEAHDRSAGPSGYYEAFLSVCAYIRGDYKTAAMWIEKAGVIENPGYHLIAAAVLAEAGAADKASRERDWLIAHAPGLVADIWNWTVLRYARPEDRDRFVESLRKAGLPIGARPDGKAALN
jgi:TolB-like protein